MSFEEFKEKLKKLDIPWDIDSNHCWNPLYMKKSQGYVIKGRNNFQSQNMENVFQKIYNGIIEDNKLIAIKKDFVIWNNLIKFNKRNV
jgi:hypothetical protein